MALHEKVYEEPAEEEIPWIYISTQDWGSGGSRKGY